MLVLLVLLTQIVRALLLLLIVKEELVDLAKLLIILVVQQQLLQNVHLLLHTSAQHAFWTQIVFISLQLLTVKAAPVCFAKQVTITDAQL